LNGRFLVSRIDGDVRWIKSRHSAVVVIFRVTLEGGQPRIYQYTPPKNQRIRPVRAAMDVVGYSAAMDVVGYSALMEREEEATYAEFERFKRELIEPSLSVN
jgi:hypothetical protein